MKRLFCLFMVLVFSTLSFAYADDADDNAKIKIHLTGDIKDNRYFLCIVDIGCLSILAASKGKVYPIMHEINMPPLFIANMKDRHLYQQGLPDSCNITVSPSQTVTISGNLKHVANNQVKIDNLRCSVSG